MSNPATLFSNQMAAIYGNAGGAVAALLQTTDKSGRERYAKAVVPLASQASGSVIALQRLPLYCALTSIRLITDTSLGSSTVSIGNWNNATAYSTATTLTSTNTPVSVGVAATLGAQITQGYDAVLGPIGYASPGQGGAAYIDIVAVIGAAALPASGNLYIHFGYVID